MYVGPHHHPQLDRLVADQCGVVHRDQLRALAVSRSYVAHQIRAGRWTGVGQNLVLLQNAGWDRLQLMWMAVLDAGRPAALGSHTSLEVAGFRAFAREAADVHLVISRGARVTPLPGVHIHESRRLHPEWLVEGRGLPRTESARSAIDAAAWQPWPRLACAMMAAVVQQRICTAEELEQALGFVGRVRHKAYLRMAVADIAAGAESLGEIDVAALCRRFRLVQPARQVPRRDGSGATRYLDCEWITPGGRSVVLEVDGSHHLEVRHWADDMRRERSIVLSGSTVLRATVFEVRLNPAAIVADLRAAGVPTLAELSEARHARAS